MPEYIERETIVDALNRLCDRVCQYSKAQRKVMCAACPLGDAFTVVEDDIPAADVAEVVRCGECKWYKLSNYNTVGIHICQRFSGVRGEHDFCSRGEKEG